MLYLLHVHWLWLFGAIALGIIVGWLTYLPHPARWTDRWVRLVAGAIAIATVVALTRLVPGRAGYWLELVSAFSIVYFVGCFIGWALRDLADFQTAEGQGAADASYLFRSQFAGLAGADAYMRHGDANGLGRAGLAPPLLGSYVAGQSNIPRSGYVFPANAPAAGAATVLRGETTSSGARKHWTWPGAASTIAGKTTFLFADDAFDAMKGGYLFPSEAASNPIGAAVRQGTTAAGLRRHWSWSGGAQDAAASTAQSAANPASLRAAPPSGASSLPSDLSDGLGGLAGSFARKDPLGRPSAVSARVASNPSVSTSAPTTGRVGERGATTLIPGDRTGGGAPAGPLGGGAASAPVPSTVAGGGSQVPASGNAGAPGQKGAPPASASEPPAAVRPSTAGGPGALPSIGSATTSASSAASAAGAQTARPTPAARASGPQQSGTSRTPPPESGSVTAAASEGFAAAGSPGSVAPPESSTEASKAAGASSRPGSSSVPADKPLPPAAIATAVSAESGSPRSGADSSPRTPAGGSSAASAPRPSAPGTPGGPSTGAGTASGQAAVGAKEATSPEAESQAAVRAAGAGGASSAIPPSATAGPAAATPPATTPSATPSAGLADPPRIESLPNEDLHPGSRPEGLVAARDNRADDLKWIKGIGPQNEGRLHGLGVWHFDQIAAWTPENVKWVGSYLAFHGRIDREKWIEQAIQLARGETTDFSKRVVSGKVSTSRDDGGHGQSNVDADVLSRPRKR